MLAIFPRLTLAAYRALLGPSTAPEVPDLITTSLRLSGLPEG